MARHDVYLFRHDNFIGSRCWRYILGGLIEEYPYILYIYIYIYTYIAMTPICTCMVLISQPRYVSFRSYASSLNPRSRTGQGSCPRYIVGWIVKKMTPCGHKASWDYPLTCMACIWCNLGFVWMVFGCKYHVCGCIHGCIYLCKYLSHYRYGIYERTCWATCKL